MRKVLKGEAAARYAYDLAAAVMAGREPPEAEFDYVSADDLRIGIGRYTRELAERMSRIPSRVSDDPEIQKAISEDIARQLAVAEVKIGDAMFDLVNKGK